MWQAIIPAAASLIGGIMGQNSKDDAEAANRAAQERMAEKNIAMQKEFAQSGIRWKVEDAKAAGVHPLYALGASSHSFAPVSVGNTSLPGSPMGSAIASMGQDVGRAITATSTQQERQSAVGEMAAKLQLDNMSLQNQLLASKLAQQRASLNPPLPSIGTATETPVKDKIEGQERLVLSNSEIRSHPGWSPAKAVEDQWGEAAGDLYGIPKSIIDLYNHMITTSPEAAANWAVMKRNARARREGYPIGHRHWRE